MAITTLADAETGLKYPVYWTKVSGSNSVIVGKTYSAFYDAGFPVAATAPAPGIDGAQLTSYLGQFPFTNPASGNTYLSRFQASMGTGTTTGGVQSGMLILADRLWHNSAMSISITTTQVISSTAWPSRDISASNNGDGVYVGLEISTATGVNTPGLELTYTESNGTTGRLGREIVSTVASSIIGAFYPIGLQAGDSGVKSIQGFRYTATGWASGTAHLVAYRPLAMLPCNGAAGVSSAIDALTGGFVRMYNNSVPFIIYIPTVATRTAFAGQLLYSQG